ncbi:Membrane-bound lytic murein transglycosylase F precursor [Serratia odorifera]|uniref:peptidoglycan lytic exotransglycosylase n=1 Tax=Serratia odorifera TaxID=618 RepID=A0A447KTH4_SEROD|nr:Membrane-bound lytic murein transglycosylase F precursor [Serratia odorifera]
MADGKLDYTLGDSVTIALLQRIHPQLAVAFDATDEEPVTWYLKRSNDDSLYAALLDFYSQMVEDGTLARLEEKYLGHVGSFDYVDTKTFLSAIDSVLPTFQPLFEKYANIIDWKLLAAIAYQESHWNPLATSPTGVRGLMMLTRATADGLGVNDRLDPEESIQGRSPVSATPDGQNAGHGAGRRTRMVCPGGVQYGLGAHARCAQTDKNAKGQPG